MENLVLGAITNYTYKDVEPWLVSLRKTGYTGAVALACFDVPSETIKALREKNVIAIVTALDNGGNSRYNKPQPWNICVERFLLYYGFLQSNPKYKYVLATDVKDVIFQSDPFAYFDRLDTGIPNIIVSSEGILYKHEEWGRQNLMLSFGKGLYGELENQAIKNAGVIMGHAPYVADLFKMIYLTCSGMPSHIQGGGGPDQAALNVILNMGVWRINTHVAAPYWACQAGTLADPTKIDMYRSKLTLGEPLFSDDKILCPTIGEPIPYSIVHQYDRVPEWKAMVERVYRE